MAQAGGSANISGILYQLLWHLETSGRFLLRAFASDEELSSVQIVLNLAQGYDFAAGFYSGEAYLEPLGATADPEFRAHLWNYAFPPPLPVHLVGAAAAAIPGLAKTAPMEAFQAATVALSNWKKGSRSRSAIVNGN